MSADPVAWRHEIQEPGRDKLVLLSSSPENPWGHWLESHRLVCAYKVTPLKDDAAQLVSPAPAQPCQGANCGSTSERHHSAECFAETDASFTSMGAQPAAQVVDEASIRAEERERMCAAIKAADDAASEGDYMLDSSDCISVIRGSWRHAALAGKVAP